LEETIWGRTDIAASKTGSWGEKCPRLHEREKFFPEESQPTTEDQERGRGYSGHDHRGVWNQRGVVHFGVNRGQELFLKEREQKEVRRDLINQLRPTVF